MGNQKLENLVLIKSKELGIFFSLKVQSSLIIVVEESSMKLRKQLCNVRIVHLCRALMDWC